MNTDAYTSVLHHYPTLPPLDECLKAAESMRQDAHSVNEINAYTKAHDFFLSLISGDANIQYDAAAILADHVLGNVVLPDNVVALLERVKDMKTSAFIRADDTHLFIRRINSKNDGYYHASAIECDCPYWQHNKDSIRICVHMAIVRVIETALIATTSFSFEKGHPVCLM